MPQARNENGGTPAGLAAEGRRRGCLRPRKHGCRQHYRRAETGQSQWMLRHVDDRAKKIGDKLVETLSQRGENPAPSWTVNSEQTLGLLHRAHQHAGTPAVDGVGDIDRGPSPLEAVQFEVEAAEERRCQRDRHDRSAVVVEQSRQRVFAAARASADSVGGFQDGHFDTLPG